MKPQHAKPQFCDPPKTCSSTRTVVVAFILILANYINTVQAYKIRPAGNFSHWPPARPDLVVGPQSYPTLSSPPGVAPVNSKISTFSSSSSESLSPSKSYGMLNCMLATHHDVTRCNNTYYQSLHHIVIRGYKRESKLYRRQFCCGYWSRERCLSDAVQRKCDRTTANKIINEKSPYSSEVDTRHTSINCLGYEQDSVICSRATTRSKQTLLTGLLGQTLMAVVCIMFLNLFIF